MFHYRGDRKQDFLRRSIDIRLLPISRRSYSEEFALMVFLDLLTGIQGYLLRQMDIIRYYDCCVKVDGVVGEGWPPLGNMVL